MLKKSTTKSDKICQFSNRNGLWCTALWPKVVPCQFFKTVYQDYHINSARIKYQPSVFKTVAVVQFLLRLKQPQTKKTTQHRKGIGYPFQEKNIPKMCNYGFELVAFIINADSLIIEAVWVVMSIFTETIMEHINHEEPHL